MPIICKRNLKVIAHLIEQTPVGITLVTIKCLADYNFFEDVKSIHSFLFIWIFIRRFWSASWIKMM
jgi:hypothetical protein